MATKTRSSMAMAKKEAKKRELMKDIDEREAKENAKSSVGKTFFPFDGVTAKSALRKASDANIDGDYKRPKIAQVISGIEGSLAGQDRDLRSIEKYGDDAMRSKKFGSREPKKMAKGGKMNMGGMMGYKKGGKIDGIAMKGKTKGRMC
jgi:hypothetical protein